MELDNDLEVLVAVPLDSLVEVSNASTENRPAASMEVHHPPKLCPAPLMKIYRPPELPPTAALMEVHRPPFAEELPAAAAVSLMEVYRPPSTKELPPAALMEIHRPPLTEELPAVALMEFYRPPSTEELLPASSMDVHRPPLTEEHPDAAGASMEELPAADSMAAIDVDDPNYLSSFPIGYLFQPSDYELIVYYLKEKIAGKKLPPNRIHEVNIYLFNPKTLAERHEPADEGKWYFLTPRDRKYKNGKRPNRAAGDGYWRTKGADKLVPDKDRKEQVGTRKSLTFHIGTPKQNVQTNWKMHEYMVLDSPPSQRSADSSDMRLDDWVLCKIFQREEKGHSGRHSHRRSAPINSPAVQEDNGEQDTSSSMEGQGNTTSPREGQSNIEIQSYSGLRDNGPIGGQDIFVQGIRSPVVGRGNDTLTEDQSHNWQKDNGPMQAQNVFVKEISNPMAGQGHVGQDFGILREIQNHGGLWDNGPMEGNIFAQGIGSPLEGQGNGILTEIQNHGGQWDNGPMGGQKIFAHGISSPLEGQGNFWQETNRPMEGQVIQNSSIINPSFYGQANYSEYPFNQSNPQASFQNWQEISPAPLNNYDLDMNFFTYFNQTLAVPTNGPINEVSNYSNQGPQVSQFASQVPHQYGNQDPNWQAQSPNVFHFHAQQMLQSRQQLIPNNDTQESHQTHQNFDRLPYRVPENDTNGILPVPSRINGELKDPQCNYFDDLDFIGQFLNFEEILGSNSSSDDNNDSNNYNISNNSK